MQSNDLKTGISMLYDMELNNYMMAKSESELENEMSKLGHSEYIDKPQKPDLPKFEYHDMFIAIRAVIVLAFVAAALLYFGVPAFGWLFVIVAVGVFVGYLVDYCKQRKNHNSVMRARKDQYNKSYNLYKLAVDLQSERVIKEKHQQELMNEQKNALVLCRKDAMAKLSEFYDKMGINEKFRNLVAMGYMNEFITLGISNKLEGTDGLYYLIMQELRWDQMQLSMQEIVDKMDSVIDNQRSIYYELMAINKRCNELVDATVSVAAEMSKNNDLMAESNRLQAVGNYTAERQLKEQEYSNFMTYYYERSNR